MIYVEQLLSLQTKDACITACCSDLPACQLLCILFFPGVSKPWTGGTSPATSRDGRRQQMPCSNHTIGALYSLCPPRKTDPCIVIS